MSIPNFSSMSRRQAITIAASCLLGLGALVPIVQAADSVAQPNSAAPLMLAETATKENRDDRQEDRQGDRGGRQDNRDDCREEGGAAGKDKRDCKQDGRSGDSSVDGDKS
jgi:hypothetical protein